MREKYPNSFEKYYQPRYEYWKEQNDKGERFYNGTLPMLCQTCQIPMVYTEPDDPTQTAYRETEYKGEKYHFCSDGCKDIFNDEPEKYIQAWMPVHQIYQGNCGGATLPEVLEWYHLKHGEDNLDYSVSADKANWERWKGIAPEAPIETPPKNTDEAA